MRKKEPRAGRSLVTSSLFCINRYRIGGPWKRGGWPEGLTWLMDLEWDEPSWCKEPIFWQHEQDDWLLSDTLVEELCVSFCLSSLGMSMLCLFGGESSSVLYDLISNWTTVSISLWGPLPVVPLRSAGEPANRSSISRRFKHECVMRYSITVPAAFETMPDKKILWFTYIYMYRICFLQYLPDNPALAAGA